MKPVFVTVVSFVLVALAAGTMWAGGVLPTDMGSPQQVVSARKAMMHAVKLDMGDMGKKFESGALADIQANAASVAVLARLMPPLYREPHEAAYDGKGKFFKGAAPGEMEAASEALRAGAQAAFDAAATGDKPAVAAAVGQMQQACGACHKAFRGSF